MPDSDDLHTQELPAIASSADLDLDQRQAQYRQSAPFLTPAMQQFAENYAYSRNQVKAYRAAYPNASLSAARLNARRVFQDDRVQAEIVRILDRWTDHSAVELGRIEHELSRIAFADPRNLFDANGTLKEAHDIDADTAAAVASYEVTTRSGGSGERTWTEEKRKVRMWDKHAANRTLAEMKGAFTKDKAPPGVQASFVVHLGAGPQVLGAAPQTLTIDVDTTKVHEGVSGVDLDSSKQQRQRRAGSRSRQRAISVKHEDPAPAKPKVAEATIVLPPDALF